MAGEGVWTLRVGSPIQVRVAIHAVRRIPGGTVLDWSLTPLPNETTSIGRRLPDAVVAALGSTDVALIDLANRTRYAPLTDAATDQCLCTRLDPAVARLRAGGTSLLQTAFPSLPAAVDTVDVAIPLVPTFGEIPVAPIGRLPRAKEPTDLARPQAQAPGQAASPTFSYPPAPQQFRIELGSVVASDSFTSITWRVQAVTAGPGLPDERQLPVPEARRGRKINVGSTPPASRRSVHPDPSTVRQPVALHGSALGRQIADRATWTQRLRRPGDEIELITTVAPLTDRNAYAMDIGFPGLTTVTEVDVTPAAPSAHRSAPLQAYRQRLWPDSAPPAPLAVSYWPTPIPDPTTLAAAAVSRPERI